MEIKNLYSDCRLKNTKKMEIKNLYSDCRLKNSKKIEIKKLCNIFDFFKTTNHSV